VPPFFEKRFGKPVKVELENNKIIKLVCGYRHTLAISDKGELYGWGFNSQQQLSHSDDYASEENPQQAIFTPSQITNNLEGKHVIDAAAGDEFSIILV
jgi:alpha-tubulin suppressor-like RCC1 family protein